MANELTDYLMVHYIWDIGNYIPNLISVFQKLQKHFVYLRVGNALVTPPLRVSMGGADCLPSAANKKPWRYQPEPEFWRDQPRLWFKQLEAIVAPQKQGDDYKYYTVIAKLPKEEIIQVSDLITCPPPIEKYKAIKERLISCYEESDQRQLQKLLSEMDLGDQKPSHLLRKMRTLSNGNISDETIKLLWLRLLPPSGTSVLAVTEDIDVNKMSQIADKILINSTRTEVSAKLRTVDIGMPTDMKQHIHVTKNKETGRLEGLPEPWARVLSAQETSIEENENPLAPVTVSLKVIENSETQENSPSS
ncbi:unnamed protein product [Spodoptera exigua]|nr:unnamed protein product [Spodoptera exigua]